VSQSKESYAAHPIAANGTYKCGASIAGFLCTVAGTLTVTDGDGTVLVNALPVAVGPFIRIPLFFRTTQGNTVTLAGGAAGTLFA
jgi:hypothetical protein